MNNNHVGDVIALVRASSPSSLELHYARGTRSRSSTRGLLGHSTRCLNESGSVVRRDRMAVVVVVWRKYHCGCGLVVVSGDAEVRE